MFIVIELQKTGDQVATLVNSYQNKNEADSKFHSVLSAAAVSSVPIHSAILMDEECNVYQTGVYKHTAN